MLKRVLILSSLTIVVAAAAQAESFSIGAGAQYSRLSGFRSYNTVGSTQTREKQVWAPSLAATYRFDERFGATLSYTQYRSLLTDRVAPTADIFGRGGIAAQVLTPYRIDEDIHQLSLTPTIAFAPNKEWRIDIGPSLDMFRSRAQFSSRTQISGGSVSENDYRLGALLNAQYRLRRGLGVGLQYRYAAPPERNIHSVGINFAVNF